MESFMGGHFKSTDKEPFMGVHTWDLIHGESFLVYSFIYLIN